MFWHKCLFNILRKQFGWGGSSSSSSWADPNYQFGRLALTGREMDMFMWDMNRISMMYRDYNRAGVIPPVPVCCITEKEITLSRNAQVNSILN